MSRYLDEHRGRFGVEPICTALGVSVSAYYQRRSGDRSARQVEDERLLARIRELHAANYYAYGYGRMWKALRRAGEQTPRCRVQRPMRTNGIVVRSGAASRGGLPAPTRRRRAGRISSSATSPQRARISSGSPTCPTCAAGKGSSSSPSCWMPTAARSSAGSSPHGADVELIHHSDRGSQYTSIDYTHTLADHYVLGSVGSVGDAYDNALAESFVDSFTTVHRHVTRR